MPFLNLANPPPPPPPVPQFVRRRARDARPPQVIPPPQAGPRDRPLRPRPDELNDEFVDIFRHHMGRMPVVKHLCLGWLIAHPGFVDVSLNLLNRI